MQLTLFDDIYYDQILTDLFQAYFDARTHKRGTINALEFETRFESNIFTLFEEMINKTYKPKPSICFISNNPVQREIFAANFHDRVIHHFIYNYISPIFEKFLLMTVTVAVSAKARIMASGGLIILSDPVFKITAGIAIY